jgi:hypothetical protein
MFSKLNVYGLILGSASFAIAIPNAYAVNTIVLSGPEHIQTSGTYHFTYTGEIANTINFFWSVFDFDPLNANDLLVRNPPQGGAGYNPNDYKDPNDPTKFIFKDSFTLFNSGGNVAGSAGSSGESHAEVFVSVSNILADAYRSNTLDVSISPVPGVPGPLPILGVAAFFGYSRKLRKCIKSSKPEVISTIAV